MSSIPNARNRLIVVAVLAFLCVAIAVWAWYYLATRHLERQIARFESGYSPVASLQDAIVDSRGVVRRDVPFDPAVRFMSQWGSAKALLQATSDEVGRGDGMAFWVPVRQHRAAEDMIRRLGALDAIAKVTGPAIESVTTLHEGSAAVITAAAQSRAAAVGALRAESELGDFSQHERALTECGRRLRTSMSHVAKARSTPQLSGVSEEVRVALLNGLNSPMESEAGLVVVRKAATAAARRSLEAYKSHMAAMLSESSGLIEGLNRIAGSLAPSTEFAFRHTEPLRQLFRDADQPLPGGELLGAVSSLFGRGSGGSMSALDLARGIDPQVGAGVDALKGLCDGIETVYREVGEATEATEPVLRAAISFRSSMGRSEMLEVTRTAPTAASYCEAKSGTFDLVLMRIASVKPSIEALSRLAGRVSVPMARDLLFQCATVAWRVVGAAEEPFQQGREVLLQGARSLADVGAQERAYLARLQTLSVERPAVQCEEAHEGSTGGAGVADALAASPEDEPEAGLEGAAPQGGLATFKVARLGELNRGACDAFESEPETREGDYTGDGIPDLYVAYSCAMGASSVAITIELWVWSGTGYRNVFGGTPLQSWQADYRGAGVWASSTPEWTDEDAHCCPSWTVVRAFRIQATGEGQPQELSNARRRNPAR